MFSAFLTGFNLRLDRSVAIALIAVSAVALSVMPSQSEAARLGGGKSLGMQSSGALKSGAPMVAPKSMVNPSTATAPVKAPAPAAAPAATPPKPASRWLGPLAGIAAGLGIGMLMSHLGLGGAMGEFVTLMIFAALGFLVIRFLVRLFSGKAQSQGTQPSAILASAYPQASAPQPNTPSSNAPVWREAHVATPASAEAVAPVASAQSGGSNQDSNWFIPADFDTPSFLQEAKKHFVAIQKIWDSGDIAQLHQFLTDDLIKALQGQIEGRAGVNETEVVLLNAELLGLEKVTDGHLASVRFSGMLREQPQTEAFRFEEIWNLFKAEQGGWMLAGIQQIPVELAS